MIDRWSSLFYRQLKVNRSLYSSLETWRMTDILHSRSACHRRQMIFANSTSSLRRIAFWETQWRQLNSSKVIDDYDSETLASWALDLDRLSINKRLWLLFEETSTTRSLSVWFVSMRIVIWLILPVVICLSQRLSHACLSISNYTVKLRMTH